MSVKQLLVLYSTVFMLLIAAVVVTLAGQSLVQASRRAYRRAIEDEMRAIASRGSLPEIRRELQRRPRNDELDLAVITSTVAGAGITFALAKEAAEAPASHPAVISGQLLFSPVPAYLVARIDLSTPSSLGIVELTRHMVPAALLGAIACAAVLAFMIGRLFLPQISALADIARDPGLRADGMMAESAPNEIVEVAQTFRRTLRQLKEERELLAAQHRELEQMQASLVRASKLASVGRLAAGIAHEIGNPLAAVRGYLSLLPRLDEREQKEVIERSAKELSRIHETIKKLLTYARQDEQREPNVPVALGLVVGDAILLVRGHPAMRRVTIEDEVGADPAADALGSAGRLQQVFVNLLLNAAQAMEGRPDPRIWIRRRSEADRVEADRIETDRVEVEVADNGPGVPPDKLEQIFDPFYTTKAPGEGTGLGLAVSRALVEGMDGELVADSAPGAGARFTVRLRRAPTPGSLFEAEGSKIEPERS